MAAGNGQFALPVKAEVRSERWMGSASRSERAVRINVMRPALDALPGSGGRPVPATTVGHCGVVVLDVDETGFHTECSTVPRSIHPSPPSPTPHPPPPERLSQRRAFTLTSTLTSTLLGATAGDADGNGIRQAALQACYLVITPSRTSPLGCPVVVVAGSGRRPTTRPPRDLRVLAVPAVRRQGVARLVSNPNPKPNPNPICVRRQGVAQRLVREAETH
eukprot:scaffold35536_cov47-Phaeocystis_antarctica.AAC.4